MEEILAENLDRNFKVIVAPCLVTKKFDRCIQVKLGTIAMPVDLDDPEAEPKVVEVFGTFSRDGLDQLRKDLESVVDPIGIPLQSEVREQTPYQWAVVTEDGEHYQQYPLDGGEFPFSEIHLPDVTQFWIIPRETSNALPWYGLVRGEGWKVRGTDGVTRSLNLPHPGDTPFWWQYYRNTSLTFQIGQGQADALPPHIVQVFGFKYEGKCFEIGVEFDGSYQVWKREPVDDPMWD